jgi:hypothetical protein
MFGSRTAWRRVACLVGGLCVGGALSLPGSIWATGEASPLLIPTAQNNSKDKKKPSARELWGMNFEVMDLKADGDTFVPEVVQHAGGLSLPPDLTWHSGIVLTDLDPAWKPIYSRGVAPVLIERAFGEGTVVIATDSYFLSNEAMLKDREPGLLTWFIGEQSAFAI